MKSKSMSRILIVEDDFCVRLGLQFLLKDMGHEVVLARYPGEVWRLPSLADFELAIVDLVMPDETGALDEEAGVKLLKQLQERVPMLPAIVLSVRDDCAALQACHQIGNVREYLFKDPDPFRLKAVVSGILSTGPTADR